MAPLGDRSLGPDLRALPHVDSRIYSDPQIFEEEIARIWRKVWILAVHESELAEPLDFRTLTIAREPVVIVRGADNRVRAFLNVCPHRSNIVVREPAGSLQVAQPSGGPGRMTCMFHAWQFDDRGHCTVIPRLRNGYQERLTKEQVGLRELRCETAFGGFIWVSLHDDVEPLRDFIGGAFDHLHEELEREPLEIFHYHKAIIETNYKLWHDTNSEFYHDYMHYFNRTTSMNQPGYFDRKYGPYANGHATVGSMQVRYEAYVGAEARSLAFPGMEPNAWKMTDLFPGATVNLRSSSMRIDTMTPLSPSRVMIEFRGMGLRRDTPEERALRVRDHNTIWGPFGRNLHEDLLGISGQGVALRPGSERRTLLHGRKEEGRIHDEVGMRHFYAEWSRRMGRPADDPFGERAPATAEPHEIRTSPS